MPLAAPYKEIVAKLQARRSWPPLKPDRVWHPGLDAEIAALSLEEIAGDGTDGLRSAQAWKAALYLWNDSLEPAHELVQELDTPTGSALHGILHRREGDYGNAKYWFRRTGDHPAWHGLQARASEWLSEAEKGGGLPSGPAGHAIRTLSAQGVWNPYLFTDAVAMVEGKIGCDDARDVLEHLQHLELAAFLRFLEARLS
ncbi:hypothetical protein GE107_13010 [Cohnella sp. CFH 77786]|uniref:hypothetical protein n=1 Tax=Cohnella sp. CFH 77786 TaxID=2662265 RepID=UPI001C60E7ED|nr:hypothetical protein [Cohnella sp. CFH 77786]MBW5446981.1 hypothetical protein [Cohnella sp. CFH 77786]